MSHFVVAATRGSAQQRSKAHLSVLSLPDMRMVSGQSVPHLSNLIRELTRIFGGTPKLRKEWTTRSTRSRGGTTRARPTDVMPEPDLPTPPNTERRPIDRGRHDRPMTRTKRRPKSNRRSRSSRQDPIANVLQLKGTEDLDHKTTGEDEATHASQTPPNAGRSKPSTLAGYCADSDPHANPR